MNFVPNWNFLVTHLITGIDLIPFFYFSSSKFHKHIDLKNSINDFYTQIIQQQFIIGVCYFKIKITVALIRNMSFCTI